MIGKWTNVMHFSALEQPYSMTCPRLMTVTFLCDFGRRKTKKRC